MAEVGVITDAARLSADDFSCPYYRLGEHYNSICLIRSLALLYLEGISSNSCNIISYTIIIAYTLKSLSSKFLGVASAATL